MNLPKFAFGKASRLFVRRSLKSQLESGLRDLRLWGLDTNPKGHLSVAGVDMVEIIVKYGSPLLVVNKEKLVADAEEALEALRGAPKGSQVLYSYKTNCIPGILKELHEIGIGAEVISPYELWLSEKLNVPGESVVYNGVDKNDESIRRAVRMGILALNIDYKEELDRICRIAREERKKINVGLRLALNESSQFGMRVDNGEALETARRISENKEWLRLNCVHFNVTSNAKNAYLHKECALRAVEFIKTLKDVLGLEVAYLDVGGGIGVPTTKNMSGLEYGLYRLLGCLPKPPSPAAWQPPGKFFGDLLSTVNEACKKYGVQVPMMLTEPGRLITSRAEVLLTKVLAIKEKADGRRFAITEAGRLSVAFPCEFEYHEVFLANRSEEPLTDTYHIMGRICTSSDWMFRNRLMPELRVGDILAVMDAGAYFSSNASNFAFPRPAIVLIGYGTSTEIRRQEEFEHLVGMDRLWLGKTQSDAG
jgi:diaminopimelate decarboxylase